MPIPEDMHIVHFMKSPLKTNTVGNRESITLPTVRCQVFKVDTFDNFEREHLIIGQLIFCHSNWSFFPSPNICSAALFVQGEEERIQNMDNETFALAKICDVQCLMKSNDLHCQKYVIFDETFKKD